MGWNIAPSASKERDAVHGRRVGMSPNALPNRPPTIGIFATELEGIRAGTARAAREAEVQPDPWHNTEKGAAVIALRRHART